jgi:DNA-binding transcriptional LysR family regulator
VTLTLPHYLAAGAVVARTDLLITLPRRIAERVSETDGVRHFDTPVDVEGFEVAVAYHPRSEGDPGIAWLRQMLRESAA